MLSYYDIEGNQITQQQWELLFIEYGYQTVKRTILSDHKVRLTVSTVWTGVTNSDVENPMIFQTKVLSSKEGKIRFLEDPEYTNRYTSETSAKCGHEKVVSRVIEKTGAKYV